MEFSSIIEKLKSASVKFEEGLSPSELSRAEETYAIRFPPDLRELLMTAIPVSEQFINWRDRSEANHQEILKRLNWPLEGMLFDIRHNSFWWPAWGERPDEIELAFSIAEKNYQQVPKLIPIYSHRYIPASPAEPNNPVFSVYQTDIIYYGSNLVEYLEVEFKFRQHNTIDFNGIKRIPFWSEIVEANL